MKYVQGRCRLHSCRAVVKITLPDDVTPETLVAALETKTDFSCPGNGRPHVLHGCVLANYTFDRVEDGRTIKIYESPKDP